MSLEFEVNHSGTSVNAAVDQHIRTGAGEWTPQRRHKRRCCFQCTTFCCTWMTSALGVSLLLVLYLTLGALMFMFLGSISQIENRLGHLSTSSKSTKTGLLEYDPDGRLLEKTLATVDRLWSITEDLNILYRENWTHLAQLEMRHYQDQIVRTLRKAMLEEKYSFRQTWTFPMSLLYALTLVTTIGYGFYTPTSLLSRSLTIAYSVFGIPLFLLYLSVVGERLGRVITGCCSSKSTARQGQSNNYDDDDPITFHYHDVNMVVQPINHQNCNGNSHSLVVGDSNEDVLMNPIEPHHDNSRSSPLCFVQVPIVVCFLLVVTYIGLSSLLLVFMEDLSFIDGFHLIVNLLLTLGFAHILPGMNGEQNGAVAVKSTSQLSLVLITFLILFGMTLLSSSFNVLLENRSSKSVTYHHIPSPSRHRTS